MNRRIFQPVFLLSVVITICMAISNSYILNLKGAEIDAERFLDAAIQWSKNGHFDFAIDAELFIMFLGIAHRIFFLDEFFLTSIGLILYYYATLSYTGTINFKKQKGYLQYIILYFIFLSPSLLFRLAALLREPYVICAIGLSLIYAKRYFEDKRVLDYIISCFVLLIGSLFHKAFLAFWPIYSIALLFFGIKMNVKNIIATAFIIIPTLIGLAFFAYNSSIFDMRGAQALQVILTGDVGIAEQIVEYKSKRDFRTTYDYGADFTSIYQIILTVIRANLYYYFAPFPHELRTAADIFACFENTIRIIAIGALVKFAFKIKKRELWFGLFVYFSLNSIWALGTSNYGTGSRHHITTTIIILYCFAIYSNVMSRGVKSK